MKSFFVFLFLVIIIFPVLAQVPLPISPVAVVTASTDALLEKSGLAQAAHYAQMVIDNVTSIGHLVTQVEYTIKSYERAAKNLASIGDVKSWDDFWEWHNRQLYLERMSEEALLGMNVTIGKKNYSIYDIDGMATGFSDTYIEYWNKEFTPEQRREMWLSLGLTPSNYAYVQTWQAREQEIAKQFLAGTAVQNEEYKKSTERVKEILNRVAADKDIGEMDDKEMQAMIIELLADSSKSLNDLNYALALQNELTAIQMRLNDTPPASPYFSIWDTEGAFGDSTMIAEEWE